MSNLDAAPDSRCRWGGHGGFVSSDSEGLPCIRNQDAIRPAFTASRLEWEWKAKRLRLREDIDRVEDYYCIEAMDARLRSETGGCVCKLKRTRCMTDPSTLSYEERIWWFVLVLVCTDTCHRVRESHSAIPFPAMWPSRCMPRPLGARWD